MKIQRLCLEALSFGILLGLVSVQPVRAGALDHLKPEEQERVKKGEQLPTYTMTPNSEWPEAKIYQRVSIKPIEAAAVFYDFELQPKYMPDIAEAKITKLSDDKKEIEVAYALTVPMLGKQRYTVLNHLGKVQAEGGADGYKIVWTYVTSDASIKDIQGQVEFYAIDKDNPADKDEKDTLMVYTNLITPGRGVPTRGPLGDWVKKKAKENIENATNQIAKQMNDEKPNQPKLLQEQLERLQAALQ